MRRNGFSQRDVNRQWADIVSKFHKKQIRNVVVANMEAVADSLPDAYISESYQQKNRID